MNVARDNILRRVRAALTVEAHRPATPVVVGRDEPLARPSPVVFGRHDSPPRPSAVGSATVPVAAVGGGADIFPPVTDPETRFRAEFAALRGEIIENAESLRAFVSGFAKIATDGSELTGQFVAEPNASVRDCDLGVTGCECLVAQTGSIIVSTLSAGGRALSVLPPVHLVIVRREQIVPDLATAMALLRKRYDKHWPSAISVITGPSRTADIEKILVMGAHGPKRLLLYFAA